jgi:DNA repair protein RadC
MAKDYPRQTDMFRDVIAEPPAAARAIAPYATTILATDQDVIAKALHILESRLRCASGPSFTSPDAVTDYLKLNIATREHEVFVVMFLDNQHRLIEAQEMFRGTIDAASVYPREVVKEALRLNANAVIFAHNHPSGVPEPSAADRTLTDKLIHALKSVDIRALDHFIIGGMEHYSFASHGLMEPAPSYRSRPRSPSP